MKNIRRAGNFVITLTNWFSVAGAYMGGVAIYLMVALLTVEVLGRLLLSKSTLMADEMSGYLLVVIAYMGLAYTLQQGGHVRIDIIPKVPPKAQYFRDQATLLLSLGAGLVLTRWGWDTVVDSYRLNTTASTIMRTPMYIPQLFMAIGVSVFTIQLAIDLFTRRLPGKTGAREKGAKQ